MASKAVCSYVASPDTAMRTGFVMPRRAVVQRLNLARTQQDVVAAGPVAAEDAALAPPVLEGLDVHRPAADGSGDGRAGRLRRAAAEPFREAVGHRQDVSPLIVQAQLINGLDASANTVPTPNLPPKCMNVLAGGIDAPQSKALGLIQNYYFREEIAGGRARGANRAASRGP